MLGEVMVAQDPTAIAHGDDLLSIREMPGESTGRLTLLACAIHFALALQHPLIPLT